MNKILAEALALPVSERIQLVQDIWDSILPEPSAVELTDAQKKELDRRLDDDRKNPGNTIPWEEVRENQLRKVDPKP